eukprot:gnl/TRDRNA2_/TRDRNA2_158861_c0_seq1.p1 gnl/TRDRNA2_/TRDRNA2_158861_c0~~gnl/TRDRNA2_/TRDRNA2_158861_c0_seq1.p1  ORF type:complete len:341 (-),score=31.83 gnl/TRDRNA2_/TRDRNA2_158861_c0_seq1:258-1280(-)
MNHALLCAIIVLAMLSGVQCTTETGVSSRDTVPAMYNLTVDRVAARALETTPSSEAALDETTLGKLGKFWRRDGPPTCCTCEGCDGCKRKGKARWYKEYPSCCSYCKLLRLGMSMSVVDVDFFNGIYVPAHLTWNPRAGSNEDVCEGWARGSAPLMSQSQCVSIGKTDDGESCCHWNDIPGDHYYQRCMAIDTSKLCYKRDCCSACMKQNFPQYNTEHCKCSIGPVIIDDMHYGCSCMCGNKDQLDPERKIAKSKLREKRRSSRRRQDIQKNAEVEAAKVEPIDLAEFEAARVEPIGLPVPAPILATSCVGLLMGGLTYAVSRICHRAPAVGEGEVPLVS